jgi:hypothetical protein
MDQPDLQNEKQLIWNFHQKLDGAKVSEIGDIIAAHTDEGHVWLGYHPFDKIKGSNEIADLFWAPFRNAVSSVQRRVDIFFAGKNEIDNFKSTWVVSMGHLMGLFDNAWLGIHPTGKLVFLRYCEFNRVENGKIA